MKKLVYLFAALMMAACSGGEKNTQPVREDVPDKRNPDLTYVDSVSVDTVNSLPVLRKNGEAFTGDVWNDDQSICQTFHEGKMVKAVLFHSPSHPAAVMENNAVTFYDEEGNEITPAVFFTNYRRFAEAHSELPIDMPLMDMPSDPTPSRTPATPPTTR